MTLDLSTLKPGDVCITRDGEEVSYIGLVPFEKLTPYVFAKSYGRVTTFFTRSKYGLMPHFVGENPNDIISLKPKVIERWVNVYEHNGDLYMDNVYKSEADAKGLSGRDSGKYCNTIRITNERE